MTDALCSHLPSHGNYQTPEGTLVGLCMLTDEEVLGLARDCANKLASLASQIEQTTRQLSLSIVERNRRQVVGG